MLLSGQEYVDEYGAKVKSGDVDVNGPLGGAPDSSSGTDLGTNTDR